MKKKLLPLLIYLLLRGLFGYSQSATYDSLDINNINARINSNGNLFWDLVGQPKFEVPKGSDKSTVFNSTLWVGGLDNQGLLHLAATGYNQVGHDYWAGPVSNVYDPAYDSAWNRTWKIEKADIDYHKSHWWQAGYVATASILNWPAHGNVSQGQSPYIAPFVDYDGDGNYIPTAGDYPKIRGDEAVFFIYNDARNLHTESGGNKLGIEVRGLAYAFACDEDSALWNTVFLNYLVYNSSTYRYHDTYIGIFTDLDMGYAMDDYIGSDVSRGSYYGYNGNNTDGAGQPYAYGTFPPAQSVTFLAGPYMDADGIDNPRYDQNGYQLCDESINGINFGNGTVDDERLGLDGFIYFNNIGQGAPYYSTDPDSAMYYYSYLNGYWKDHTQMLYGGNAHTGNGAYGPACKFMFPADSDTCNWGTGGIAPNGPSYWTEQTAGNQPYDRRGLGSTGPFTLERGGMQELDMAFVFGRNYLDLNAWGGVITMQQRIDSIRKYFITDTTPCGSGFSSVPEIIQQEMSIKIYPNPASDFLIVENTAMSGNLKYEIYDIVGRKIISNILSNKNSINISNLPEGLYLLKISDSKNKYIKKFIKQN